MERKIIKPTMSAVENSTIGIENIPRLATSVLSLLNQQITNELYSAQIYAAMASWLDDKGWVGGSKLFLNYSKEEQGHMYKIYDFLFEKNCKAEPNACNKPNCEYSGIRDILEKSLQHEFAVTKNWMDIATESEKMLCHDAYLFAQGFIKEQREEEEKFRNLLFLLNRGIPEWELDAILGSK